MPKTNLPTVSELLAVSSCEYAEGLSRQQFIDPVIRQLWSPMPRIAGPAFTVKCGVGDHLSLHAAIYRAKPGDVIVVQADPDFASAGGNVCAVAQKRGIVAMVIDGLVRDLGEIRDCKFPVYARGMMPKPAGKKQIYPFNQAIQCGGVTVHGGDYIIADEDGIAVIPKDRLNEVYALAKTRTEKDAEMNLIEWEAQHSKKIESKLKELGFSD
ncbi:RraA family protein [Paraglaciecola arctica]|uniref:Putative 4-hydroxy-4-methyl-2-oxoglutarate aldolase n=1 Tax=Paraglaciecola arctica BSs20135 TaxID=493475 RepID=K6YA58_9ALTE|nr:RraA family protein [Paraglaciecola arctica]GAC20796.1 conserved domain protein [Paraglaciecola arctica BSs20135]